MNYKVLLASALAAAAVHANTIDDGLPDSWFKAGKDPAMSSCTAGTDSLLGYSGEANITLQCESPNEGFITAMQQFNADNYRGSRIRFSAQVKAEDVLGWSGLWMRVDATDRPNAAFDNMRNRLITGSQEWTQHEVVLDVPNDGEKISFGILLVDKGQVWLKDVDFEVVPTNVATTAPNDVRQPENLDLQRR